MSQLQQESYQVIFKNTPQKFYQTIRMVSMLKQFSKTNERKKMEATSRNEDWETFSKLREELELPITTDMKVKFTELTKDKRLELIRDCEKKLLIKAGEKEYDFLLATNKMLAEPQILNKDINLDQLKNMMTEYGLQFHIKELSDQTKELHFFAKDANIAARALDRTLEEMINHPESVTKPTLDTIITKSKEQSIAKQEEMKQAKETAEITTSTEHSVKGIKEVTEKASIIEDMTNSID